jgi:hypothetical protein
MFVGVGGATTLERLTRLPLMRSGCAALSASWGMSPMRWPSARKKLEPELMTRGLLLV